MRAMEFVSNRLIRNLSPHESMDFGRGRAVDTVDTLKQVDVLGLDADSVDSQIGLKVGSCLLVEQPVTFAALERG